MSDESYRVQVTLNLPPSQQYEKGDMLNVRGNSFNEVELALGEVVGADEAKNIIGRFFTESGAAAPQPVPMEAPPQTTTPAPAVVPVPAPVVTAPQIAAPQVAPQAGVATPGIEYPTADKVGGALLLGAPCPKCSVVTYWQPPGINFKTQKPFDGYWRCANQKNHP